MDTSHDVVRQSDRAVLVVTFSGEIPPGSEGNEDARIGTEYIKAQLTSDHAALVLDLTDLDYVWGNHVGGWFLVPAKRRRVPVRLVATGRTARALQGLLGSSGLACMVGDPIIQPSVAAALASLG